MKAYRAYQMINDVDFTLRGGELHDMTIGYASTIDAINQLIIGWAVDQEIETEYKFFKSAEDAAWVIDSDEESGEPAWVVWIEEIDIQE